MTITLLHTSASHPARFDAIRDRIDPEVMLNHTVRENWLSEAQHGISDALKATITLWISGQTNPVLCTCTTLCPIAEAAGALRIDRPLMQRAAEISGPFLLVYCLDSTRHSSEALLREEAGRDAPIHAVSLTQHWSLFEAGDITGFEAAIAKDIRAAKPKSGCVVLAQASMAGAASHLEDLPVPVLSSPALAIRRALQMNGQNGI